MLVRNILTPTDLSENSMEGISYAIALAKEKRAQLILLHVIAFPVFELNDLYQGYTRRENQSLSFIDFMRKEATTELNRFARGSFGDGLSEIDWQAKVAVGGTAAQIVTAAFQTETDIIVMAKRQRGWLARFFSPSISESVSREAPCPVLSICPPKINRHVGGKRIPVIHRALKTSEI